MGKILRRNRDTVRWNTHTYIHKHIKLVSAYAAKSHLNISNVHIINTRHRIIISLLLQAARVKFLWLFSKTKQTNDFIQKTILHWIQRSFISIKFLNNLNIQLSVICTSKLKINTYNELYGHYEMGITKLRTSATCGHLRTVVQILQIKGLET